MYKTQPITRKPKRKEYCVVESRQPDQHDKDVTYLLNRGWSCQGGIHVVVINDTPRLFQAMTRLAPEKD